MRWFVMRLYRNSFYFTFLELLMRPSRIPVFFAWISSCNLFTGHYCETSHSAFWNRRKRRKWEVASIFDPSKESSSEYFKQFFWEQAGCCARLLDIFSCVFWNYLTILVFLRVLKLSDHSAPTSSSYRFGNRDRMFLRDLLQVRKRGRERQGLLNFSLWPTIFTVCYRHTCKLCRH